MIMIWHVESVSISKIKWLNMWFQPAQLKDYRIKAQRNTKSMNAQKPLSSMDWVLKMSPMEFSMARHCVYIIVSQRRVCTRVHSCTDSVESCMLCHRSHRRWLVFRWCRPAWAPCWGCSRGRRAPWRRWAGPSGPVRARDPTRASPRTAGWFLRRASGHVN